MPINSTFRQMDKFLERHKLPKVKQQTENINIKEITHISKLFHKENSSPRWLHW